MNHHRSALDDAGDREIILKSSPTWQAAALVDCAHTGDLPQPALLLELYRLNRADLLASAVRDVLGSSPQAGAGAVLDGIRSNISACTGSPDTHSTKEDASYSSSFYVPLVRLDVPLRSESSAGRIGAGLAVFCQDSGLHPLDEREDVPGPEGTGTSKCEVQIQSIPKRGHTGMRRQRLGAASECACSLRPRGASMADIDAAMAQAAMGCAQCHLTRIHAVVEMASRCAAQQGDQQTATAAHVVQASRDAMGSAISSIGKLQIMADPAVAIGTNQSTKNRALAGTHSFITARAAEVWIEGMLRMVRGLAEARHRLSTRGARRNTNLRAAGRELEVFARAGLRVAVSLHGAIHAANESIVRSEGSYSDTTATRSVGAGLSAFLLHLLGLFKLREAAARVWDLERLVRPHPGLVEVDALIASLGGGPAADGIRQRLAACRPSEEVEIVREGALLSPDTEDAYSAVHSGPDEVWELAASRSRPGMLRYVALSSSAPITSTYQPTRELGIPHWVWHSPLYDSSDSLWCRGEADGDVLAHDLASIAAWQLRSSAGARKLGRQAAFRALDVLGYRWPAIRASGVSLDAGSRVLAIRALGAITPIVQAYTSGSVGDDSRWVLDLQTWLDEDVAGGRHLATTAPKSSSTSVTRSTSAATSSTSTARRQMERIEDLVATGAIGSAAHAWLSMVHDSAEGDIVGRAAAWPLLGGLAARVSLERQSRVLVDSEFAALYAAADAGMQEWNQALGTGSQMVTERRTAGLTRRQRNRSSGGETDALESCRRGGGLVSQQHPAILQVFRTAGHNVRGSEASRAQNGRERLSSSHHLLVQADGMHEEAGESGPVGQLRTLTIDPPKLATAVVGSASSGQDLSRGTANVLTGNGDDTCFGTHTTDPAHLLGSSWIGRVRYSGLSVVSGVGLAGHCRHHGDRGATQWLPQGLLRDLNGSSRGASMAGGLVGLDFALDAVRLLGWCVAVGIPSEEQERRTAAIAIGRVGLALHDVKMLRLALSLTPSTDRECRLELAGYLAECLRATWVVGAHSVPRWAREAISIDWEKGEGDSAMEQAGARAAAAAASAACRYGDPHAALWAAIRANPAQEML